MKSHLEKLNNELKSALAENDKARELLNEGLELFQGLKGDEDEWVERVKEFLEGEK
jgi:hypothetical protein